MTDELNAGLCVNPRHENYEPHEWAESCGRTLFNRGHVDELNAHRPGWDRKPSPWEQMIYKPAHQPDHRIVHAPGHCQAECAYVGHNVVWPNPTAKEWRQQQVFVSGRQNGKWAQFKEKAAQLEQYFVPEQIVDYGHTVGYYVQPRSVEVDRSFENEVRLHG